MKIFSNQWVRMGLTVLLLGLVIAKIQPVRLLHALGGADSRYAALAFLLTIPFLYLRALRWHLMLRAASIETVFWESGLSLIGGMGLALITPARLGELVRAAYLRDPQKLRIGGLVMIDKAFDVIVLAALSGAGAWHLLGPLPGAALLAVAVAGLAAIYAPEQVSRSLHFVAGRTRFERNLRDIIGAAESLSFRATTIFLALTVASFAVVMLQFAVILLSWRSWSLDIILLTFPLVILTNILPITIGGLGVREGAAAVLLAHYGVPSADAALTALISSGFNTYLPGVVGALLFPIAPGRRTSAQSVKGS